jgi:hypothetical protein
VSVLAAIIIYVVSQSARQGKSEHEMLLEATAGGEVPA